MGDEKLEQSCNPITKGMDADYLIIYLAGERFYTESSSIPFIHLRVVVMKVKKHGLQKFLITKFLKW